MSARVEYKLSFWLSTKSIDKCSAAAFLDHTVKAANKVTGRNGYMRIVESLISFTRSNEATVNDAKISKVDVEDC